MVSTQLLKVAGIFHQLLAGCPRPEKGSKEATEGEGKEKEQGAVNRRHSLELQTGKQEQGVPFSAEERNKKKGGEERMAKFNKETKK